MRALLLAILLAAPADAGPFSRRFLIQQNTPQQETTRQLVASTRNYTNLSGSITGDVRDLPQEPEFYTVVALPVGYSRDASCRELIDSFATDPTLVALRRATCVQMYAANDPDFQHRFKPQESLQSVWNGRGTAVMVVDRDGGLVWWMQGGSSRQYAADILEKGVLEELNSSTGGLFRIRRPKVCTPETCPPQTPGPGPQTPFPDNEPLRPTLPPIGEPLEPVGPPAAPDDPAPPVAPPVTPPQSPPPDHTAEQIKQLQAQLQELKNQITINMPSQPIDYDQIAEEVSKRLTHSAEVTLLDGTRKLQVKPLTEPLEFVQRQKGLR